MLQSKTRMLELNAKLAETLTSKGVSATADETTTALVNKVADIKSGDTIYFNEEGKMYTTNIIFADNITMIGNSSYKSCTKLQSVVIKDNSATTIQTSAFHNCTNLQKCVIGHGVKSIGYNSFAGCPNLTILHLPNTLETLHGYCYLTSSLKLAEVVLEDGFNFNGLSLKASTLYSRETIVAWLVALADRTGQTAYTLTIGATNLAKLTEDDILIATNKNWTLA